MLSGCSSKAQNGDAVRVKVGQHVMKSALILASICTALWRFVSHSVSMTFQFPTLSFFLCFFLILYSFSSFLSFSIKLCGLRSSINLDCHLQDTTKA